jgi:hypothetical protein
MLHASKGHLAKYHILTNEASCAEEQTEIAQLCTSAGLFMKNLIPTTDASCAEEQTEVSTQDEHVNLLISVPVAQVHAITGQLA